MPNVLSIDDVRRSCSIDGWQRLAAEEALAQVAADGGEAFPCVFAAQAAARGGFRFCFANDASGTNMAAGLRAFLRGAREIGPYAALFYIFPPEETWPIDAYRERFWAALARLRAADERAWPDAVPQDLHHQDWTFCFDGEAVFPLCLTPAHVRKRTRHARHFTISFQPRWTFKHHLPDMAIMHRFSKIIQRNMARYDESPVSPFLGLYGSGFLDAQKYFFDDDNLPTAFPDRLG